MSRSGMSASSKYLVARRVHGTRASVPRPHAHYGSPAQLHHDHIRWTLATAQHVLSQRLAQPLSSDIDSGERIAHWIAGLSLPVAGHAVRQVGKIKEYSEPDPVDGFLNRVRAELQRPTDTRFPRGAVSCRVCYVRQMLQAADALRTNILPSVAAATYVRRHAMLMQVVAQAKDRPKALILVYSKPAWPAQDTRHVVTRNDMCNA